MNVSFWVNINTSLNKLPHYMCRLFLTKFAFFTQFLIECTSRTVLSNNHELFLLLFFQKSYYMCMIKFAEYFNLIIDQIFAYTLFVKWLVYDFDTDNLFFSIGRFINLSSVSLSNFILDMICLAFKFKVPHFLLLAIKFYSKP